MRMKATVSVDHRVSDGAEAAGGRDARHPTICQRSTVGAELPVTPTDRTTGKVAIYVTCYGYHNEPQVVEDLIAMLDSPNRYARYGACTALRFAAMPG